MYTYHTLISNVLIAQGAIPVAFFNVYQSLYRGEAACTWRPMLRLPEVQPAHNPGYRTLVDQFPY